MELVLALAILPLGVAVLVSVLTGKPFRVEITHKHPETEAVPLPEEDKTEQRLKETVAQTLQELWMGVETDDDRRTTV